jgi:hypothetical protein
LLDIGELPFSVTTTTSTVPAACAGEYTCIEVDDIDPKWFAHTLPNSTPATGERFVPVIVTGVPPPVGPEFGEIPVTVGGEESGAFTTNVTSCGS